jgi:hypothetical protein
MVMRLRRRYRRYQERGMNGARLMIASLSFPVARFCVGYDDDQFTSTIAFCVPQPQDPCRSQVVMITIKSTGHTEQTRHYYNTHSITHIPSTHDRSQPSRICSSHHYSSQTFHHQHDQRSHQTQVRRPCVVHHQYRCSHPSSLQNQSYHQHDFRHP